MPYIQGSFLIFSPEFVVLAIYEIFRFDNEIIFPVNV